MAGLVLALPAGAASQTVAYTAHVTIPVPPASSFSGSAGGDGWDLSLTPTAVYNVFHHNSSALDVACHKQVDATKCWDTDAKTITDGSGNNFTGPMHSGTYLDQATGKLYIYTTRTSDNTAGVACVDTTKDPATTTLFCGFTALSAVGDGGLTSLPMKVGSNLYSFNYVTSQPSGGGTGGTANKLLCFSLTSFAACAGQPFSVNVGAGNFATGTFPNPATATIGGKILVPTLIGNNEIIGCFDPGTGGNCAGSWPITLGFTYASSYGSAFPLLNASGATTGFCLPTGTDQCFDLTGASVATPVKLATAVTANSRWNGPAVTIGARVYVPNGNTRQVQCFNYATGDACASFPKSLANSSLTYTVNVDPQRPACLWVNSDSGSAQIQNFDAFSGGPCGQGAIRVLSASFVAPGQVCAPTKWQSLVVNTPARNQYTSGTVDFQDADANPIPGVGSQPIDASGGVNLSTLALTSTLPQFLITLTGLNTSLGQVVLTLTWDAIYDPSCVSAVVSAQPPATTTTTTKPPIPSTLPPTGSSSSTPLAGSALALIVVGAGLVLVSVRFRTHR